jgi:hypothetical protein
MWDGRETFPGETIHFDLSHQSNSATVGHAQGAALSDAQRESIVAFETALFTAQVKDERAGQLTARGAMGGPVDLSSQEFYIGINDLFGDSQSGAHGQVERHRPLQRPDPPWTCGARSLFPQWLGERPQDSLDFYDERFGIGFTDQEKADLIAFLRTL